jgi:hypothetical protein
VPLFITSIIYDTPAYAMADVIRNNNIIIIVFAETRRRQMAAAKKNGTFNRTPIRSFSTASF